MAIWDRFRLDGRRALVTGGSRGLGRAIAGALAEAGADLVLVSRDAHTLGQAANELRRFGHLVDTLAADVADPEQARRTCERALAECGAIDILVNNVGGRRVIAASESLELADWRAMLDLNLTSVFVCCKVIGGEMVRRRSGRIVNVSSIAGQITNRGVGGRAYEAAKAGVVALTKALAADWAPAGVRVNAIVPGGFRTEPVEQRMAEKPDWARTFLDSVPMGRLGEPEEIAPLALYLASDASSYVTGAAVVIDGGYTLW